MELFYSQTIARSHQKSSHKSGEDGSTMALAKATFNGSQLTDVKDIFVADAWAKNEGNLGSRIAFAPDGLLYMTVSFRPNPLKKLGRCV